MCGEWMAWTRASWSSLLEGHYYVASPILAECLTLIRRDIPAVPMASPELGPEGPTGGMNVIFRRRSDDGVG